MKNYFQFLIKCAVSCLFLVICMPMLQAQNYPNRTIKLIASFPPGGTSDILARLVAQKLGESLGQTIVVENRPGASGNIGHDTTAKSAPDGYTLLLSSSSAAVNNPFLFKQLPFDWYRDFSPISMIATASQVLVVHPSVPAKNLTELTALLKANPGKYNFGSGGKGIQSHITGEIYKSVANVDIVHIPYKGSALAVADVVAGQIQMVFSDMAPGVPLIKANKVRPLAVTSLQRSSALPDVPTMAEQGYPGFQASVWWSLVGPKGIPTPIIDRINLELSKIMVAADTRESFEKLGITPLYSKPEGVFERSRADSPVIGEILRKAGIEKE